MKKTFLLTLCAIFMAVSSHAQRAKEEFRKNIDLVAGNYMLYPEPESRHSRPPKGYEPYYINAVARHGSRWLIGEDTFNDPLNALQRADDKGKLTSRGREVLAFLKAMRDAGLPRQGELTSIGAEQHRGIARRMFENFPQVFKGKTRVDARSTIVIRCIMSMQYELLQLAELNPEIDFTADASAHDMQFMNNDENGYNRMRSSEEVKDSLKAFWDRHTRVSHLVGVLFNDTAYAKTLDMNTLSYQLFHSIKALANTPLRDEFKPMWDIFTFDELYDVWQRENADWYCLSGPNRMTSGAGMYAQIDQLRHLLSDTEAAIGKAHPGADLHFGHESTVLPLVCLLNIDGMGNERSGLESLDDEDWCSYRVFPMSCNVQFVFYKPKGSRAPKADDVLMRVLLNERDASLPINTDCAPFYHWPDVRAYLQTIFDNAPALKLPKPKAKKAAKRSPDYNSVGRIDRYAEANKKLGLPRKGEKRVVFFGNSITDFWPQRSPQFFKAHPNYIGRGMSGHTSYQFLLRFREDVVDLHPSLCVILGGANDIAENFGPYNEDHTFGNIITMVDICRANNIPVVLCSNLPASRFPWRPAIKDAMARIRSLNARLKAWCKANKVTYVDYFTPMLNADGSGLKAEYVRKGDTVHPSAAGYKVMESVIEPVVERLLK